MEAYLRVNARWCYLWCVGDQRSQLIDYRLTAAKNALSIRATSKTTNRECSTK
ncbi:MAG: DDE-type integrase/transposase/recombinase [Alphaproteobacteria bacterium]